MTNKTTVVHLVARMNVGGPAFLIDSLIKNLNNEKFRSILITGYCEMNEIDYLETHGKNYEVYQVRDFGRSIGIKKDFKCLIELVRIIKKIGPDIVHTHTAKAGFLGRIAAFLAFSDIKIVHTYHGHLLHGYFSPMKTKLIILSEKLLGKITSSFIAIGNSVKNDLIKNKIGSVNRFHVIFPGLPDPQLDPVVMKRNLNSFPRKHLTRILFIGRLTNIKCPHRLIEIANELSQRKLDFEMLIAGGGELLPDLEASPLINSRSVKFLGWRADIYELISTSDIGILTSLNEGIPLTLIQFAQMGLPAVSTSIGSVNDVIENEKTGFLIDYDVKLFADAIEFLIENPEIAKKFGENARLRASQYFSTQTMVKKHRDLYDEILNN